MEREADSEREREREKDELMEQRRKCDRSKFLSSYSCVFVCI